MHFGVGVAKNYRKKPTKLAKQATEQAIRNIRSDKYLDSYIQFSRAKKQEYNKIKAKYSLPEFEKLEKDFEFLHIKENLKDRLYLLRIIRRHVYNKIVFLSQLLERILFPNSSSLVLINESKFFSEKQHHEIFKIYKILMKYERLSLSLDILNDEGKNADFIKEIYKKWPNLRDYAQKTMLELSQRWEKEEQVEERSGYLG